MPRIISAFYEPDGCFSIVMSMLGPSVDQLYKEVCRGALSIASVLKIGVQVVDVLAHMHARSIIHNDIKPGRFACSC